MSGCTGKHLTTGNRNLMVSGTVILPDSTALFGAEISTEPPTGYVSTDEQGHFSLTLPKPDAYTVIATHPDTRFQDMEGRVTDVEVAPGQETPLLVIMMGRTQRMPLMDVDKRADPALRRGKKRTGR